MDTILEICESITPTKQMKSSQCLRCLEDMIENTPCPCKPCKVCNSYCPVNKPHIRCGKSKQMCNKCNNYIISYSRKCLLCAFENQKTICKKCPLLFKENEPVYCACTNVGGGLVESPEQSFITRYAFSVNNTVLDIYLNPQKYLLFTPQGYFTQFKKEILCEIKPLIKEHFATSAKIYFYVNLKMRKLLENSTYDYDETILKTSAFHINPQAENVTEEIIESAIAHFVEAYDKATNEGSGWSLQALNEIAITVVASHKCGIPTGYGSVGTWTKIATGLRGRYLLKNLEPSKKHDYNCVESCIRLHLASIENPQILVSERGVPKYRYNYLWKHYPEFRDVKIKLPPFEDNQKKRI